MRYSSRASALVLFLSLLPSMALVAHWPQASSEEPGRTVTGVHVRASHDHGDPGDVQGATCGAHTPCADAAAHGVSGASWIGANPEDWHQFDVTYVHTRRMTSDLPWQSSVSPEPFPPRAAVS